MSGCPPGCMPCPLALSSRSGLDLVASGGWALTVVATCSTVAPVSARLRVGALFAAGLLIVVSTPAIADAAPANIAGKIVFLDPGHNGSNDSSISRQVPTGRGGTKDCQASGTSTDDGYPEHTFTWETVLRIRQELTALGVRTAMSRGNDNAL